MRYQVSVGYFAVLLVGFLLWIAYGAAAGILGLVIPNIVAFLVGAAVVTIALRRSGPSSVWPDWTAAIRRGWPSEAAKPAAHGR
jgi:hypothetical protein